MILTHTGKLGDFAFALPIAQWLYRRGEKTHWVLTNNFKPFSHIESLLCRQPFTERVTLVPFPVQHWGRGGQPYRFSPADYGVRGEYLNIGFRNYPGVGLWRWKSDLPNKYVAAYYAEEHKVGYDDDFTLDIGDPIIGADIILTEQLGGEIDTDEDILTVLQKFAGAKERHAWFSGLAHLLYYARVRFHLHRGWNNPPTRYYYPDKSRYTLIRHWNRWQ